MSDGQASPTTRSMVGGVRVTHGSRRCPAASLVGRELLDNGGIRCSDGGPDRVGSVAAEAIRLTSTPQELPDPVLGAGLTAAEAAVRLAANGPNITRHADAGAVCDQDDGKSTAEPSQPDTDDRRAVDCGGGHTASGDPARASAGITVLPLRYLVFVAAATLIYLGLAEVGVARERGCASDRPRKLPGGSHDRRADVTLWTSSRIVFTRAAAGATWRSWEHVESL